MAVHHRSLPVFLAIFLIGLSFSTASVVNLRKYNSVLHQIEDRVRSPKGPGKQGPPGDHGPLVGPGGPPAGNGTSGIFGPGGPGGPGFLPVFPTGEKCVSMCEKLKALIDSLEANVTETNVTAADPDIPPVTFFVFLLCSNSTADGPLNQTHPGKSEESSEESGESEESSEESGEDGDSAESSEEEGDDETGRWISWDQLETKRQRGPGHFHKVCRAYDRLMNLQSIRQTMDNATHFNQSGPLQPVLDYVHDVCQNDSDVGGGGGGGGDGDDDDSDGDSRMIRKGPHQHSGGKFGSWERPPGPTGDPITEFCEVISIVFQPMGGNVTAPDGSAEVIAFFKDMVSCLCNIDLNK